MLKLKTCPQCGQLEDNLASFLLFITAASIIGTMSGLVDACTDNSATRAPPKKTITCPH